MIRVFSVSLTPGKNCDSPLLPVLSAPLLSRRKDFMLLSIAWQAQNGVETVIRVRTCSIAISLHRLMHEHFAPKGEPGARARGLG